MSTTRLNALDPALDIAGSLTQNSSLNLSEEASFFGPPLSGQTGSTASITTFIGDLVTLTGLTGMTTLSVGNFLTVSGGASISNNGTFLITEYISSSSIKITNASGIASDANNGAIIWIERSPYTLQDDLNYARTDRAAIKGAAFSAAIPTYQRPTAVGTNIPTNLSNIAGKTLDAHAWVINRKFENATVAATNTFITISSAGALKHADSINRTGIPIQDGADIGAHEATYVEIIDPITESALEVLSGIYDGYRIFGRTRAGSSTSPNSVEIEFRAVLKGNPISTSIAYTWETGQPTTVDLFYGYRERSDQLTETAFRTVLLNGVVGDADINQDIVDVRTTIGIGDNVTNLDGLLTNTSNYYAFSDLPDGTPSVVEALNTLNFQIGSRNYSGSLLLDGQTITASLQNLAAAIGTGSPELTENTHKTLRQLIHFIDDGPGEGFATDAYRETLPLADPFPTSIIWWESSAKLEKIVEKTTVRNANKTPDTIKWEIYDADGVTVLSYIEDTILYSGIFELNRTRAIVVNSFTNNSISENTHKSLRHLIHFISEGPADGFATGAYRETLPSADPLPTSIIWWESSAKTQKIVEKTIIRNINNTPNTTEWIMYDTDGVSVLSTVTDTYSYSGIFETNRVRVIT